MNRGCLAWGIVAVVIWMIVLLFAFSCTPYQHNYIVKNLETSSIIEGKAKYLWTVGDTILIEPTCDRILILYRE